MVVICDPCPTKDRSKIREQKWTLRGLRASVKSHGQTGVEIVDDVMSSNLLAALCETQERKTVLPIDRKQQAPA